MGEKLEDKISNIPANLPGLNSATALDLADWNAQLQDVAKKLEWMTWRISYLERSKGGEKRGFSRPVEATAALPMRPQSAVASPSRPTEDAELWARTSDGRQRLRRQLPQ